MDRVFQGLRIIKKGLRGAGLTLPVAVVSLIATTVMAGTVLLPPAGSPESSRGYPPQEEYPESRFGQPPMDRGKWSKSLAAREAEQWTPGIHENGGTSMGNVATSAANGSTPADPTGANRSPAGLVLGKPGAKPSAGQISEDIQASIIRRKGVQEVALIAGDLGFFPRAFFVTRDIPVRLFVTGASKNTLCIMMDSFQIRRQVRMRKIEEITFTPSQPGKFRFYCPVNGMEGTMVVKELTTDAVAKSE